MNHRRLFRPLGLITLALTVATAPASVRSLASAPPQHAAHREPVSLTFDLAVIDAAGRVPEALAPGDLAVTVDGRPRSIAWVRRVSRGPGALADAATRRDAGHPGMDHVAEPSRTVLVVIDEPSLPMGGERPVIQGAVALLDRLGIADRVAVVRLPSPVDPVSAFSADRPVHRGAINRIAGRIPPEGIRTDSVTPDASHIGGNPMGARINREDRPDRPEPIVGADESVGTAGGLDGLIRVLRPLGALPGRKTVAFFSSGLDDRTSGRLAAAARVAAEVRATLFVLGLPVPRDPRFSWLDARLLAELARVSGGVHVKLGRNPARDIQPLVAELDACYHVGLRAVEVPDTGVNVLRVAATRPGLVVRGPAFVASGAPASDDVAPPPPAPLAAASDRPQPAPYRGAGRLTSPAPLPPSAPMATDAELHRILGRLIDYTQAYIGQYSALVAEEEYRQFLPLERRGRRLRSDLLFVRSESAKEWVSFRDVYEVDGKPVRDRDTRLQDLFLKPRPDGRAQLLAIKEESARYNIGSFERNINVPLFPLKILNPDQRKGFVFSVGRAAETAGVKTWRLIYRETARPSLVHDRDGLDVPLQGYFVLEQATGAIVETEVSVEDRDYAASIVVRYARNETLGMWLPADMKETYRIPLATSIQGRSVLEGTARYANFRRFQVTTDVQVGPQK